MKRSWRRHRVADGMQLASETTTWGAAPQPFVLASHATGFCKEVFRPVIDELVGHGEAGEVLAFDHRAHGQSEVPPPPYDWWDLGRDVVSLLEGRRGVIGVGHSAGAAALVLAELLAPGSFAHLLLVEPIVFPGPHGRSEPVLVDAALKRKAEFPSREEAIANWREKPAFASWTDAALAAYAQGGLVPDGGVWRLACPPEAEAEFYRGSTAHGGWDRLGAIASDVVLVAGEHSDTHPEPFLARTAEQLGGGHVNVVPGASHFVLMERPEIVASHLQSAMVARLQQQHADR